MADGDHKLHEILRGTVQTTNNTPALLVQRNAPGFPEGIVKVRAYAQGIKTDGTKAFAQSRHALGVVNGGSYSQIAEGADGTALDFGTSGYSFVIDVSAGFIRVMVTGATSNTVRWQGRLEIEHTEAAIT
jgi:hypothetical protein